MGEGSWHTYSLCVGTSRERSGTMARTPEYKWFLKIKNKNARVGRLGLNKGPLAAALHNKHFQVAELLHQHGAVLAIGRNGCTLLHAASMNGSMDVAQWLIKIGVDANAQDNDHETPLHLAAVMGHLELVRTLLEHSVDVNAAIMEDIYTLLHEASKGGHVDIARLLIQNGAEVNAQDGSHGTPLHMVSLWRKAEIVQLLIQHGADINARTKSQSTPLHLASFEGDAEAV